MEDHKNDKTFEVDQHLTAHGRYYAGKMGSRFYISLRDKRKILGSSCKQCNKTAVQQDILAAPVHLYLLFLRTEKNCGNRAAGDAGNLYRRYV